MKQSLLIAVVAAAVTIAGCSGGMTDSTEPSSSDPQGAALPPEAAAQIEALISEKAARTPAQRKISSQLLYAQSGRFKANEAKPGESAEGKIRSLMQVDKQGRVLSDIRGDVDGGLQRKVEDLDGKVVTSSSAHRSMRAWLHLDSLESLAAQPIVTTIRPAMMAETERADPPGSGAKYRLTHAQRVALVQKFLRELAAKPQASVTAKSGRLAAVTPADAAGATTNVGAANSEGSTAHGADKARKFYNTDGTGIKIGVLSDSDDLKEESIATGDLPADTVTVPGQDGRPGSGEGTAMMEIVHDVAPGAKLFFASAFNSPESFADNIRTLRFTYHCDIIVDDVIYYFESPYQDDIIAQAVNDVTHDGAMYFSSAGNEGNFDDGTSGTWEGDFKAAGTLATLPSGYTVHDFGSKVISNRIEAAGGPLILHWSDSGSLENPTSSNDYDLFVLDADLRNVAVASTDVQDGTGLPFEFLGFFIPPDFRVVIAKHPGAQNRAVRIVHFGGEFGLSTNGAVYGHNSADDAFAVAAVDSFEANGGLFTAGPTTPIELFSADGPRQIFYNENGVRLHGGVTFASGGGEKRRKPEIAGADGVSTTLPPFSGLNPFFGTSAAAPHVAAIAGLIKSAVPGASSSRIRQALVNGALDIEQEGNDRNSGAGIASAMNSLREAGARPAVFLDLGTVTVTPTSGTALLPGGSGSVTSQILNNGGATATSVSSTLASSSTGVTITVGTSAYPNIPAGGSANNNTPFQFSVSPSVSCGSKLNFAETVKFTGRGTSPRVFALNAQTGAPSPLATHFPFAGSAVEIPDSDALGVDIPLDISGVGALSQLKFNLDGSSCSADVGSTTVGVDHTWVGDLVFKLTSPEGTSVTVINQAGGAFNSGNNFCQTLLLDGAADSIQDVTADQAPFTSTFSPANALAAYTGENADGTWVLNVSDNALFDTGSVRYFSIDASGFTCTP
ncbi:MAG TPA: S8 family serine peptidase [Steroidobacteraceae bacterium]|nr:S8 family serine peptidase [Steroidobacteraceae bacterium]